MKEHVKTALLVLLGLSALYLLGRTWIYDSSLLAGRAVSNPILAALFGVDRAEPEIWAPARLDYAPSSVSPARCALMRGGMRTGAQYGEEAGQAYEAFRFMLAEAFGAAGEAAELRESEWREKLRRDSVYFEFSGRIPLSLLAAWLSADSPGDAVIEAVGLSFTEEGGTELLWAEPDGTFYGADVYVERGPWPELPELRPCAFAFEADGNYAAKLAARQLIMEEAEPRETLGMSAPPDIQQDLSLYAPFLEKLELSPLGTPFYMRGGARVYVDVGSGRSCEISPDGTIFFSCSARTELPEGSGDTRPAAVLLAWETVSLLEPVMGGARFEVCRVTQTGAGITVEMMPAVNGVPVLWEPAVVEVERGAVRRMSLRLCRVTDGAERTAPLPLRQAAALLPDGGAARLGLRYAVGDDGYARAVWAVGS
ncbi:MAG: hypothetical protein LBH95_02590 [Oscillospiraceae bacterium]|jgi:hypothetical protein|nr:hypothetical protein [Oscillospiraceae bacterium]